MELLNRCDSKLKSDCLCSMSSSILQKDTNYLSCSVDRLSDNLHWEVIIGDARSSILYNLYNRSVPFCVVYFLRRVITSRISGSNWETEQERSVWFSSISAFVYFLIIYISLRFGLPNRRLMLAKWSSLPRWKRECEKLTEFLRFDIFLKLYMFNWIR